MFERGISKRRLQQAVVVTYVFFGAYALLGLAYVWYAAVRGDIVQALLGLGVALGSIGLGIAMYVIVQLAGVVAGQMEHIESLQMRADASETLLQELTETPHVPTTTMHDTARITAANLSDAGFPRIHREPHATVNAEATRAAATATSLDPESLRQSFRASVFAKDFAGALAVGGAILEEYPDGEMAAQFRMLKPTLEARLKTG